MAYFSNYRFKAVEFANIAIKRNKIFAIFFSNKETIFSCSAKNFNKIYAQLTALISKQHNFVTSAFTNHII